MANICFYFYILLAASYAMAWSCKIWAANTEEECPNLSKQNSCSNGSFSFDQVLWKRTPNPVFELQHLWSALFTQDSKRRKSWIHSKLTSASSWFLPTFLTKGSEHLNTDIHLIMLINQLTINFKGLKSHFSVTILLVYLSCNTQWIYNT